MPLAGLLVANQRQRCRRLDDVTASLVGHPSIRELELRGNEVSKQHQSAVGKPLAQYLGEKIWKPYGMETDATWWLDSPDGHEIGGSGFSATLRDYGRFGLFFLNGGLVNGDSILPAGWLHEAGSPKTLVGGAPLHYGYMWWPMTAAPGTVNDGAFSAEGIFGQYVYINPREHVVIVQWSAQTRPTGGDVVNPEDFFAAVSTALH